MLHSQAMTRMMTKLFAELDVDDDKAICADEWTRRKGNPEDYRQIVSGFDKNGTALLSFLTVSLFVLLRLSKYEVVDIPWCCLWLIMVAFTGQWPSWSCR